MINVNVFKFDENEFEPIIYLEREINASFCIFKSEGHIILCFGSDDYYTVPDGAIINFIKKEEN